MTDSPQNKELEPSSKPSLDSDVIKTQPPAVHDVIKNQPTAVNKEYGGPKGLEPTRYGDWEQNGRCTDF